MKSNIDKNRPKNILSESMRIYYASVLDRAILPFMQHGIEYSTTQIQSVYSGFNSDHGVLLRKCLRTLEYEGKIVFIKGVWNFHKWKLK